MQSVSFGQLAGEADLGLMSAQDIVGKRLVEAIGNRKLTSAQPDRPGLPRRARYGLDFCHGAVIAHDEQCFPRLNSVETTEWVFLDFMDGYCGHDFIISTLAAS